MPAWVGAIAAVASLGVAAYGAKASSDAQSDAKKAQQKQLAQNAEALKQQGIVTQAQKQLLEAETNAITDRIFQGPSVATTGATTPSQMGVPTISSGSMDMSELLKLGGIGIGGFIVYKILAK